MIVVVPLLWALTLVVPVILAIWVLRSALAPIEEQLRRIADEIEVRNTMDAETEPINS